MSMRGRVQCVVAWVLLVGLFIPSAFGQSAPAALQITIVGRNGGRNDINGSAAYEPIVQVEDENHEPVAGALVSFSTPFGGPGGFFPNGVHTFAALTDQNGRAMASGLYPNSHVGIWELKVSAAFKGVRAETVIMETNVSGAEGDETVNSSTRTAQHRSSMKWILIGAGVAGGVVAGVLAAKGGGSGAPTGLTITPGTGTVGAPPKP